LALAVSPPLGFGGDCQEGSVDSTFWLIMAIVIVASVALPLIAMFLIMRSVSKTMSSAMNGATGGFGGFGGMFRALGASTGTIQNGIPADAVIQGIAETGMTVTTPGVGPEAPVYRLSLLVNPPGGGQPYPAEVSHAIPRIYAPMTVPGARIGVLIDPANPQSVVPDFSRYGGGSAAPAGGFGMAAPAYAPLSTPMTAGGVIDTAGVQVQFDAQGNPMSGMNQLVGAVQSGQVPTIKGKAATLLATGAHGTAVITSAQPLGKKVRDIDPSAEPSHLDDPIWVFTVEVTLAGRAPFTAMFGHRVPTAKVYQIGPGVKLAVAVDESNPSQEVAIDWDQSPLQQ
jgi:hypothetical protein